MSTFRRRFLVVVDGVEDTVESRPADFLGAERDLAHEGIEQATERAPIALQMRIVWRAWSRTFPDRPGARDWAKFLGVLEDATDLDAELGEPLSPTPPAGGESSP